MENKILLIGGGGHCVSVLDTLLNTYDYSDIGIIEKNRNLTDQVLGVPIIGCDEDLPRLYQEGFRHAFVTVGSIGNPKLRIKIFSELEDIGFCFPNIIDKTAIVSKRSKLDKGIFVGKNAVINAGAIISKGAIINTSTIIEHDCTIEEFAHIAPGSTLCGEVHIGKEAHVGAQSVIKQQIRIGEKTVIGIGSVVVHDIRSNNIAFGNPCKEVQPK